MLRIVRRQVERLELPFACRLKWYNPHTERESEEPQSVLYATFTFGEELKRLDHTVYIEFPVNYPFDPPKVFLEDDTQVMMCDYTPAVTLGHLLGNLYCILLEST
jgi:hypothetical protein